jgi:hypothetical protein
MIKMVKLKSGEEIVAEVTQTDNQFTLKDCAQIGMVAPNQMGIGPYLPYCDLSKGITVDVNNVLFMADISEQFRQEYQKMFSKVITKDTGIIL